MDADDPDGGAYQATNVKTAQRLLLDLAQPVGDGVSERAESVPESLDGTPTVLTLELSPRLRRSLATTNAVESPTAARGW